ncbi:MAG: MBL fold metallo-hydrolase [Betaproteobacteria bacterium]|nr:MBL fold metallo-hydrolase [Betaproteobacteria bacterium]
MRFTNLKGNFRKPETNRVLRWMLGLHEEKRPKAPSTGVLIPYIHNDGKQLRKNNKDTLTWIGHASFLVQLAGKNILIDPVLSMKIGWIKRNSPPGISWPAMPKIDLVLITHNHRDHMDAPTLKRLGPDPVYLVPKGLGQWFLKNGFKRVIEMGWWQQEEIAGLTITFVPAEHWSRRNLADINTSWWGGFVIEKDGLRLYHSGDTGWFDGFAEIGKRCGEIHAAMLPIGAYAPRWFMKPQHINPDEAVDAIQALGAKHLVPMHWGTFKLSDEPLNEPPLLLHDAWERANLPDQTLQIATLGQIMLLDRFT